MEINYNLKIVSNERIITAKLDEKWISLIENLHAEKKDSYKIPFMDGNKVKEIEFTFFNAENGKCYVKFTLHKYTKTLEIVEKLIEAADKQLEIISDEKN